MEQHRRQEQLLATTFLPQKLQKPWQPSSPTEDKKVSLTCARCSGDQSAPDTFVLAPAGHPPTYGVTLADPVHGQTTIPHSPRVFAREMRFYTAANKPPSLPDVPTRPERPSQRFTVPICHREFSFPFPAAMMVVDVTALVPINKWLVGSRRRQSMDAA
ncbi:hypothetical protein Bbelb_244140 [Branchiostoma belcheri]|nr:hypothetical protein Bbelb_244140 [Branchiostoma belcheri]